MSEQPIPLNMIVRAAAGALNESEEYVKMSIIEGVASGADTMSIIRAITGGDKILEGWDAIGDAMDRSARSAMNYHKEFAEFRKLVKYTKSGKPTAKKKDIKEWWVKKN
jgi:hypothetical protein